MTDTAPARRCVVCRRPRLREHEPQTCSDCVARSRQHLDDIAGLARHLPAEALQHPTAPIPGGTSTVLLAGGSTGAQWAGRDAERPLVPNNPWTGRTSTWPALGECVGDPPPTATKPRPSGNDNLPDDPPSLAHELGGWEDAWRREHQHPAASWVMTIPTAIGYLRANIGWAAQWHPSFDEFAADLLRLRGALIAVTRAGRKPDRTVTCMHCREDRLERPFNPPRPCRHVLPVPRLLVPTAAAGGWRWAGPGEQVAGWRYPTRLEYEARTELVEAWHEECRQGGRLDDRWECPRCGARYDEAAYWLAVKADLEAEADREAS